MPISSFCSQSDPTVRSDEWPAWFSFWFFGCWRALAKGTAWAGFIAQYYYYYYFFFLLAIAAPPAACFFAPPPGGLSTTHVLWPSAPYSPMS